MKPIIGVVVIALVAAMPAAAQDVKPQPPEKKEPETEFEETVVVSATRTNKRLDDQPLRVEVLAREEIEEKMLMTPGDIVMMLNETGGLRVQATSPSLGAASVRIQGMRGRYTRFLSDGLPLYGEVGGLGLLQIPPMDLGQVEVIKGVASSMYGAGAMGGVVNLMSRRPGDARVTELLLNRSMRGATDAVSFFAAPLSDYWGLTLLGSGHWQTRTDVDEDGWSDLPRYDRGVIRPRIFWENGRGSTFFATVGGTFEDRQGGGPGHGEALETRRIDGGFVAQTIRGSRIISARAAMSAQRHDHLFGDVRERDRHETAFGELAVRGAAGRHTWVVGGAFERDAYRPRDLPQFEHSYVIPGVFAQDDVEIVSWLSLSASARLDHHSEYGTFLSPRVAALFRAGDWNSRLSIGTGFFGPSVLTEETEAAGLTRLVVPLPLQAERAKSMSFDVTRTLGAFSTTVTLFGSRIDDPVRVNRTNVYALGNVREASANAGAEVLATYRHERLSVTSSYAYVRSREFGHGGMTDTALTPRHSAGLVGVYERHGAGRIGIELYYTGRQRLEDNPFASTSEPYVILGLMAEKVWGAFRVFVNGENLTDVRQSKWHPLARPNRAVDGRWTVDAWSPLEGRNVNAGVRISF
ncbi:MAG TPA: TonB-dependent receptor [Vicinamibacterales bacterium]|nr:TonB-dependent receptor [Vicinamibacterales bacterium]